MPTHNPPTAEEALDWYYNYLAKNHLYLCGAWHGWRMAGRELVSPDGTRFSTHRLQGLAWRQDASNRLERAVARNAKKKPAQLVRVVVVDLETWRAGQQTLAG